VSPGELIADATLVPDAPLRWSTGAMTASGFAVVCAEVASRDRPSVLECGSGFSTLKLAELTHERGGRLVSLEHDELWATRVRSNLAAAGLAETARVTLAPLQRHPLARDGLLWYAEQALRFLPRRIDLLLVDGPPAFEPETDLSRYPALPALAERLAATRLARAGGSLERGHHRRGRGGADVGHYQRLLEAFPGLLVEVAEQQVEALAHDGVVVDDQAAGFLGHVATILRGDSSVNLMPTRI